MKIITIYPTSVKFPEDLKLEDLLQIEGFKELLSGDILPERERVLVDRCQQHGIDIHHVISKDGYTDEKLIDKDALKAILEASTGEEGAYGKYFNAPAPEVEGINADDFKKILPLFCAARRLGIAMQIKTCSDEDFRNLSENEVKDLDDKSDTNGPVTITFSTRR